MDADSISHMMHNENFINCYEYEAITAAPNDISMNRLLLQYVRTMDMPSLLKFCCLLKNIETQQCIGANLEKCMQALHISHLYSLSYILYMYLVSYLHELMAFMFTIIFFKPGPSYREVLA